MLLINKKIEILYTSISLKLMYLEKSTYLNSGQMDNHLLKKYFAIGLFILVIIVITINVLVSI